MTGYFNRLKFGLEYIFVNKNEYITKQYAENFDSEFQLSNKIHFAINSQVQRGFLHRRRNSF